MELRRRIDPLSRKDLCSQEHRTSTRSSQVMPRSRCIWTPRALQNLRNRSKELLVARDVHIRQELRRRLRHMPRNEEHYTPDQRTTPTDGDPRSAIRDYHHGLHHRPPHLERIRLHPRCTDKCTKTIILSPCNKDADALKTADMLMNNVFRYYGTPKKIISDRGPQFASQVMKTIAEGMGIRMALSTAYHPQTDSATERVNQELEQYLRAYCNRNQNNWADLLPYAEISHNTRIHSATRQVPFETLHGFLPHWATITKTNPDVPAAHQRLQMMEHA